MYISTNDGKGGVDQIDIKPVTTRYVKMQGYKACFRMGVFDI